MNVIVLAKENKEPGNIALAKYLDKNFEKLLQLGYVFKFKIVNKDDEKKLVEKKITGLPSAIVNKEILTAATIEEYFSKAIMGYKSHIAARKRLSELTPEEQLREEQMKIMNPHAMKKDEANGNDDEFANRGDQLRERAIAMQKERDEAFKQERVNSGYSKPGTGNADNGGNNQQHRANNVQQKGADFQPTPTVPSTAGAEVQSAVGGSNNPDDLLLAGMFDETY